VSSPWQSRAKLPLARLSQKALLSQEAALSPELAGGLWFEADATLDPRALLSALRIAAEKRGAEFRSGSIVKRIAEESGRAVGVELTTDRWSPAATWCWPPAAGPACSRTAKPRCRTSCRRAGRSSS
jgi:L-2-hydroxyglutarate oxidase LhgO